MPRRRDAAALLVAVAATRGVVRVRVDPSFANVATKNLPSLGVVAHLSVVARP